MTKTPKKEPSSGAPSSRPGAAIQAIHYVDDSGRDYINEWLLKMKDSKAKIAIDRRFDRISQGNFGDCKPLRDGVWELRIDVGSGYRVYYAKAGTTVVLLLCGGDKRKQDNDIERACGYWKHWQQKNHKEIES